VLVAFLGTLIDALGQNVNPLGTRHITLSPNCRAKTLTCCSRIDRLCPLRTGFGCVAINRQVERAGAGVRYRVRCVTGAGLPDAGGQVVSLCNYLDSKIDMDYLLRYFLDSLVGEFALPFHTHTHMSACLPVSQ
jgi:hypothetical protein